VLNTISRKCNYILLYYVYVVSIAVIRYAVIHGVYLKDTQRNPTRAEGNHFHFPIWPIQSHTTQYKTFGYPLWNHPQKTPNTTTSMAEKLHDLPRSSPMMHGEKSTTSGKQSQSTKDPFKHSSQIISR
jgi:hypothetical protein